MQSRHRWSVWPVVLGVFLGLGHAQGALGYITTPVPTLGRLSQSTYITVFRVENVSKEKGIIVYRKVRDLKGSYPKDVVKHVFSLKNTPQHNGAGDVPVKPNETDWRYALEWAKAGKTAVLFSLKYDPFGDFGHTYIDGCWYATMCPGRDWEFWYSIYSDADVLNRWHCGTPAQLITAMDMVLAGKEAVVPVLAGGATSADLRDGKAKVQGLRISAGIMDYDAKRDRITDVLDRTMAPSLVKLLAGSDSKVRAKAAMSLGLVGASTDGAGIPLLRMVRDKDDALRLAALTAVANIGLAAEEARQAAPVLAETMKDREPMMRRIAALELGELGPQAKDAIPVLAALLAKAEGAQRLEIAEALVRIDPGNTAAGDLLAGLLEDPKAPKETRMGAGEVLRLSKAPTVTTLIRAMKDADRDIRLLTADLLGQAGPFAKEAVPALAGVVADDASGTVRARAATALAKIGPEAKAALPAMKAALSDPRLAGRQDVLDAIGEAYRKLQ